MRTKAHIGLIGIMAVLSGCIANPDNELTVTLQNQYLQLTVNRIGAELTSIKLLADSTEYLWQGDTATWADHAIVQFPIIGNLKNGCYHYQGKTYSMMSHGFARISQFAVAEQSATHAVFQLKSNAETQAIYPFEFLFRVKYSLEGQSIKVGFEVRNEGKGPLYFSLGYHPGFNWPIEKDGQVAGHYLEFSDEESAGRLWMNNNLIDSLQDNYLSAVHQLPLRKSLFQHDAIILEGLQSSNLSLKSVHSEKAVTLTFGKVPYLGIWSPPEAGKFVCVEPWHGIPDTQNASANLSQKRGIIPLPQSGSFSWECVITVK